MEKKSHPNKKIGKSVDNIKSFFSKSQVKYSLLAVFILIMSFLVQYFINKPNLGTFLGSDMDPSGSVYVLGVDKDKDQYKITKILGNGSTEFKIDLEKSNSDSEYSYSNIECDSKGNFYFVKQQRNLKAVVADKSLYPIKSEVVLMYDTNGNYIKQLAAADFSKDANPPTSAYIKKLQLVNQSMTIIGCKDNVYDIITANPLADESPKKTKSFEIKSPTITADQTLELVSDMSVLSSGRVFYATKNGKFMAMDNDNNFVDYSSAVSTSQFLITGMSVDPNNNVYFTDSLSGNFYKLDTQSIVSKSIYNLESSLISNADVKVKDVRKIKVIDTDEFYAPSKAFDKPFYVRFGTENMLISDIHGAFFPWGLLIMVGVCILVLGVFYGVRYLSHVEIKRISLGIKILSMFLPVYLVAMGTLVYINTSDSVTEYVSILKSEQERGAKTVADDISGSGFSNLDHVKDYMSTDYIKLRNSIEEGYNDISLKIGDRSDYLITYIERYDKLYTTINTRYSVSSSSYDELKYTDPDIASSQCTLVDSVLERDETEALYNVWNQFSNKTNTTDSLEASFRDVYGNMTASFVAIKDTNGRVVGFVGNFLDSGIHSSAEFWRIFQHSLAIILIITVLVFAYIAFTVKWSLRPLKKIEGAINTMSKGEWHARIRLESKDELADIAQAFNLMSEKIDRYTSNLIRLNKEYVRYVPTQIFRFMDKEKITQVKLYDHKILNMNIIYLTFNISSHGSYDFKDENEIFDALNESYKEMFRVVENNNGVVQSFDGLDAVILFPGGAKDAFNSSVQFKEINIHKAVKDHMNITLGAGKVLIGVSGNDERRGVVVVSDEIMQMFNIDTQIGVIGINQVATKTIIDNLDKSEPYSYRYIGRVGNITGEGFTDIYEMIDASNKYKKDLYLSTKEMFEKGVESYILSDFEEARRIFTDVLRINEKDKVSIHYLMKCEEQINRFKKGQIVKKGFTGYIT